MGGTLKDQLTDWNLVDPNAPPPVTNALTQQNLSQMDQDPMRFAMGPAPGIQAAPPALALGNAGIKALPAGVGARMPPPAPKPGSAPMGGIQFMTPGIAATQGPRTVKVPASNVDLTAPENIAAKDAVNKEAQGNVTALQDLNTEKGQLDAAQQYQGAQAKQEMAQAQAGLSVADTQRADAGEKLRGEYDKKFAAVDEAMAKQRPKSYDDWWDGLGTGDQVRYWISGVLGGFLQGWQNRPDNPALKHIHQIFESEVAKEQQEYDRLKDTKGDLQSAYAEGMRQFGNPEDAKRAAIIDKFTALQSQTDAAAMANGTPSILQNARAVNATLDQQKTALKDQGVDNAIRLRKYTAAHLATVGGAAQPKQTNSLIFAGPDGKRYTAANRMSRNTLAEQSGAVQEIDSLAKKLDELRNNTSTFMPGTKENADASVIGAQLQTAIRNAGAMGVYKESEVPVFEQMLGDPTGIVFGGRAGQKAMKVAELAKNQFQDRLRAEAAEEVDHGYAVNPKTGQMEPVNPYAMNSPSAKGAMDTPQQATSAGFQAAGASDAAEKEDVEDAEDRKK